MADSFIFICEVTSSIGYWYIAVKYWQLSRELRVIFNKDNHLIPKIRSWSMVLFITGVGLSIVGQIWRFIAVVVQSNECSILNTSDACTKVNKKVAAGASISAAADVLACLLLLISLFSINTDLTSKFKDVVNLWSLGILSFSYCAFVSAIIEEDVGLF